VANVPIISKDAPFFPSSPPPASSFSWEELLVVYNGSSFHGYCALWYVKVHNFI
jgi:hypothetical protein